MKLLLSSFLLLALLSVAYGDACKDAFAKCRFEFFGNRGKILVIPLKGKPDRAVTPRIISKRRYEIIGVMNTDIPADFILPKGATNITSFGKPKLAASQFKPFYIEKYGASGIGFQTFQGNGKAAAGGRCVRVYFTDYQVGDRSDPSQMGNAINLKKKDNACIVFKTK